MKLLVLLPILLTILLVLGCEDDPTVAPDDPDPADSAWTTWTPADGLPHGAVTGIEMAPDGSLCRYTITGGQDQVFVGPARVFRSQRDAVLAIFGGHVRSGDVLVIRYQGPRGGPGFSENFRVPLLLGTLGMSDVAVVTDSRFSGATEGALCVGYVSPEAQVGGPLAIVEDGDEIRIDCQRKRLEVDLDEALISERLAAWQAPRPPVTEGVLVDWHLTATQFPEGAMLQRRL
jgi:dihydroxy-acid dehydratase